VTYSRKDDGEQSGIVTTYAVYVLRNIMTRSRYRYCNGNATVHSVCIVGLRVLVTLYEGVCTFMVSR
jgi:hypothetical protein